MSRYDGDGGGKGVAKQKGRISSTVADTYNHAVAGMFRDVNIVCNSAEEAGRCEGGDGEKVGVRVWQEDV